MRRPVTAVLVAAALLLTPSFADATLPPRAKHKKKKVVAVKDDTKASGKGTHSAKEVDPPKGELWAPVEGHWNYADILNGKRNGFFVNLSSGARRGMTFVIEHHGGKTYHVYGDGKHRQMVEVRAKADASTGGTPAASGSGK